MLCPRSFGVEAGSSFILENIALAENSQIIYVDSFRWRSDVETPTIQATQFL